MTARAPGLRAVALLVALLCAAPLAANTADFVGRDVATIEFKGDAPVETAPLESLVAVKAGRALDPRDVDASIRVLFATRRFRDVRVDASILEDGRVALTFQLSLNYIVRSIVLSGLPEKEGDAKRQVVVAGGDILSLSAVDRSANALVQSLRRRGYLMAVVDPETKFARATSTADVTFHIEAGPRAAVGSVRFDGTKGPFNDEQLMGFFGQRAGQFYSAANARQWGDSLSEKLIVEGYRACEVKFDNAEPSADGSKVALVYRIDVGPLVRVEVEGVPRREIKTLIPFKKREPFSDDRIEEAVENIVTHYQERGFYFVEAEAKQERDDRNLVVTFVVTPGKKYGFGAVRFEGNRVLSDAKLLEAVSTRHADFVDRAIALLTFQRLGATTTGLDDDRDSLESLYRLNGFETAVVDKPKAVPNPAGLLDIVFPITEGPQTILSEVRVEGNEGLGMARLEPLQAVAGEPLNPQKIAKDLVKIQIAYGNDGYADARVNTALDFSADRTSATLTYKVTEGERFRFGNVLIRGNTKTKDSVIRIKTRRLKPGTPYSLEQIDEAQRDLYKLGIFNRVSIKPGPVKEGDSVRDVDVEVEDGKSIRVGGSVGYSTDESFRISGVVSNRNLFGKARYLGLDALYSKIAQRWTLTYQEPFTFGKDLSTQYSVFQSDELKESEQVLLKKRGLFVELSKYLTKNFRTSLRYDYRLVETTCDPSLDEETCNKLIFALVQDEKEDTIASVTQTIFWDHRDDPIDPRRGYLVRGSLEYAFPAFASTAHFLKGFAQGSWFVPIGRATLALSGRTGLIEPYNGTPEDLNPVPYSERFFGGGENSHRGFRLDEMGIVGEVGPNGYFNPPGATIFPSDPTEANSPLVVQGGNALLIGNFELRYPLSESLGVATFVDVGQVWRLISTIDLSYLKYAVGTGIFYRTPVGPVRFDVAYNIDAQPNEERWLEFFTIGFSF